jgi:hypothetical protein
MLSSHATWGMRVARSNEYAQLHMLDAKQRHRLTTCEGVAVACITKGALLQLCEQRGFT